MADEDKIQEAKRFMVAIAEIMDKYDDYTGKTPMSSEEMQNMMMDAALVEPIYIRLKNIVKSMTPIEYNEFESWLSNNSDLDPSGWGMEFGWGMLYR